MVSYLVIWLCRNLFLYQYLICLLNNSAGFLVPGVSTLLRCLLQLNGCKPSVSCRWMCWSPQPSLWWSSLALMERALISRWAHNSDLLISMLSHLIWGGFMFKYTTATWTQVSLSFALSLSLYWCSLRWWRGVWRLAGEERSFSYVQPAGRWGRCSWPTRGRSRGSGEWRILVELTVMALFHLLTIYMIQVDIQKPLQLNLKAPDVYTHKSILSSHWRSTNKIIFFIFAWKINNESICK